VKDPELTAVQYFNALSTKYPAYVGAPVEARLLPENDEDWQQIELGDAKKSPALKKTSADWLGPDMDTKLAMDVPKKTPVEEPMPTAPLGFVKDKTLLPVRLVADLMKQSEFTYFDVQPTAGERMATPAITNSLVRYLDEDIITPGLVASAHVG